MNVYQTAVAIRFADAVLRIGRQYDIADRFAKESQAALNRAACLNLDITTMRVISANDRRRADAIYATLMILLADVPEAQVYTGIDGKWRVRVEWRPLAEKDKVNVYAQAIE
jgi:hypothetical protein